MKPLKQGVYSSRTADKFVIRFLQGMREHVKEIADGQHRSMNSQIVAWIEMCLRIHAETGHAPSVDILLDGVQAAKRCAELEAMLKKLMKSGAWYGSAIELEHGVNGNTLYQEVADLLENKSNFSALISQFESLANEMQPGAIMVAQQPKFIPHVGDPLRFDNKVWILDKYEVKADGNAWAHISRGMKNTTKYDCTVVAIEDMAPL